MSASSEMISLPLQQTARYLVLYPDEVTSEEEKILRMLFGDERYESIEELYDPRISDDIKRGVQFDEVSFFDYLKVWAAQGLRHPKVYLDSALLSGIGYWWPSYPPYELIPINPKAIEQGGVWSLLGNEAPEFCFSDAANTTVKVLNIISNAPVLSQLYKPAIYVWTMLFALAVLASRKSIFAALPASLMVVLLVCMVSPLNSSMRYALPIAFSAPLLIGLLFAKNDVIKPAQFNMPSACQRLSGVRKEKCCE